MPLSVSVLARYSLSARLVVVLSSNSLAESGQFSCLRALARVNPRYRNPYSADTCRGFRTGKRASGPINGLKEIRPNVIRSGVIKKLIATQFASTTCHNAIAFRVEEYVL